MKTELETLTTHSKGPWTCDDRDGSIIVTRPDGMPEAIGQMFLLVPSKRWDENRGNFSLVAAAPELLGACIAAADALDCVPISERGESFERAARSIRAAINLVIKSPPPEAKKSA